MAFGQPAALATTCLAQCLVQCKRLALLFTIVEIIIALLCSLLLVSVQKRISKMIRVFWNQFGKASQRDGNNKRVFLVCEDWRFWLKVRKEKKMEILWLLLLPSHSCGFLGKYYFPYGGLSYSWHVWERIRGRWGKHLSPQPEQALQVSDNSVPILLSVPCLCWLLSIPAWEVFIKREIEGILVKPSESFNHACSPSISTCTDSSIRLFIIALFLL